MNQREVEKIAREAVPVGGAPRMSRLGSGLLNDTYRIDRDGRVFSLRVAVENAQGSSTPHRVWELAVLRNAAERGLAPPLVYGSAERGFLVQEWIDGRAWDADAVRQATNIASMADLLRRVHGLSQPVPARTMHPRRWIEHYGSALAALKNRGAATLASRALASAAAARLDDLDALPGAAHVICHSDLHLMNLIELPAGQPRALMLLDWEYAHVSEPFWDLAGWAANNDFPDRLLHELLGAYLGREPLELECERCALLVWLYDYVCLSWSELYLSSSRGSDADDTVRYGISRRMEVLNERLAAQD